MELTLNGNYMIHFIVMSVFDGITLGSSFEIEVSGFHLNYHQKFRKMKVTLDNKKNKKRSG